MLQMSQPHSLAKLSLSHALKDLLPDTLSPHKPENYLLMSEKNAITDWPVDCSGSAVFYHVLSGVKEVVFVEPTVQNKELFEDYLMEGR